MASGSRALAGEPPGLGSAAKFDTTPLSRHTADALTMSGRLWLFCAALSVFAWGLPAAADTLAASVADAAAPLGPPVARAAGGAAALPPSDAAEAAPLQTVPLPTAEVLPEAPQAPAPPTASTPAEPSAPTAQGLLPAPSIAGGSTAQAVPTNGAQPGSSAKLTKVMLGDQTVFTLAAPRAGRSVEERARLASRALASVVTAEGNHQVRTIPQGSALQITAGEVPIVTLTVEDATLAGADSLDGYAALVATAIEDALSAEQERGKIAQRVFSASLVVFFAIVAFYLLRKMGELAERLREWIESQGDRLTLRVRQVELVSPELTQTGALIALGTVKWLGRFGIIYAWLLVALSMFESTRGYTQRLTGWVLAPLTQLMERIATTLPVLVVLGLAVLATWVLVRFVALLFEGVARRETTLSWVPADMARPMSVLVRLGIVLAALVFAAPVVTGDADGALARAGMLALLTAGLSAVPLLSCALVGALNIFGRRLRVGDHVQWADRQGRVAKLGLIELFLEQPDGTELRLPHLFLIWSPFISLGKEPRLQVRLWVAPGSDLIECERLMQAALMPFGSDVRVDLLQAQATGLEYSASVRCRHLAQRSLLLPAIVVALQQGGIALGAPHRTSS